MDDLTEELAHAPGEGFPCAEADRIEDLLARLNGVRDDLGLTALQLRTKARLRFNKQRQSIAAGRHPRTTKDALTTERQTA